MDEFVPSSAPLLPQRLQQRQAVMQGTGEAAMSQERMQRAQELLRGSGALRAPPASAPWQAGPEAYTESNHMLAALPHITNGA